MGRKIRLAGTKREDPGDLTMAQGEALVGQRLDAGMAWAPRWITERAASG